MKQASLGDLTNIRTGKLDANAASENGEYPFFTCAQEISRIDNYSYEGEVVLVAGNGDLNVKYYEGKFDAYQRTYIVESRNNRELNTKYLYYFLSKYVEKLRKQSIGGVIKYIKLGYLTEAEIPLPSIEIQNKIVEILDQAEEVKRKRGESIKKLNELKKSIFYEMFGDPVQNSKNLEIVELGQVLLEPAQNGLYLPKESYLNGDVEMVHMSDAFYDIVEPGTLKKVQTDEKTISKYKLQDNDILIARRSLNIEGAAKPCLVQTKGKNMLFESSLIKIRSNPERVHPIYLFNYLKNERVKKKYIQQFITSSTISGINQSNFLKVNVLVPTIEKQIEYVNKMGQVELQSNLFLKSDNDLELLSKALIQKAFKGELTLN